MKAKDKAKALVERFDENLTYLESKSKAKQCALICVDEILKSLRLNWKYRETVFDFEQSEIYKYWQEVKKEIEES